MSTPIDVILHSGPAHWWEILTALGPLAVLIGAVAAAIIGWKTLQQRRRADDRAEWWRRAQWALDHAAEDNPVTKALGLETLTVLATSTLAQDEEVRLFDSAWESVTAPRAARPASKHRLFPSRRKG